MTESSIGQTDLPLVRELVKDEICERHQLEKNAFPMTERMIIRKGRPCGMFFCMHGPRSVRITAVWDMARRAVILYDTLGQRDSMRLLATD
jgi:hypothetical protein